MTPYISIQGNASVVAEFDDDTDDIKFKAMIGLDIKNTGEGVMSLGVRQVFNWDSLNINDLSSEMYK